MARIFGFSFTKAYNKAVEWKTRIRVDSTDKENPYEFYTRDRGKSLLITRMDGYYQFTLVIYYPDGTTERLFSRNDKQLQGILIDPRRLASIMRKDPEWATCEDGHVLR